MKTINYKIYLNGTEIINNKCTAANERFHASGGADSYDTEQVTASFGSRPSLTDTPARPPSRRALADMRGRHLSGTIL